MPAKPKPSLGAQLVESMRQAVAIKDGRLRPARRHRLTLREARVAAPPRMARPEFDDCESGWVYPNRSLQRSST